MTSEPLKLFGERLRDFISRTISSLLRDGGQQSLFDLEFNELAVELFRLQYDSVQPYKRWCEFIGIRPSEVSHWSQIPAIPIAAFKEQDLTSIPSGDREIVFHSSGTTRRVPGRHWHNACSISLYEASLLAWFRPHILPELGDDGWCPLQWLALSPPPRLASRSSLVHMLGTVISRFGSGRDVFAGQLGPDNTWLLNIDAVCAMLEESVADNSPVCILATAFHCVQLIDNLAERNVRFQLPPGSRLMETGGYKGRAREIAKQDLYRMVRDQLGINYEYCVSEYGMTELSSQAYDWVAGQALGAPGGDCLFNSRCFRFPPWARIQVVSPENSQPVPPGQTGLLRVYDLANVYSVMAVQTDDLVILRNQGFEFVGRSAGSEPRGCSLMAK